MVSAGPRGNPSTGRYGQPLTQQLTKAEGGLADIARIARHSLAPLAGVLVGLNAIGGSLIQLALNAGYTTEAFRLANREFYRSKIELAKIAVEAVTPILQTVTSLINTFNRLPKGLRVTVLTVFLFATALAVVLAPMLLMIGYTITLVLQLQRWSLWARLASIGNLQLGASSTAAAAGTTILGQALLFLQVAGGPALLILGLLALTIWSLVRAFRSGSDELDDFTDAQNRALNPSGNANGNRPVNDSSPYLPGNNTGVPSNSPNKPKKPPSALERFIFGPDGKFFGFGPGNDDDRSRNPSAPKQPSAFERFVFGSDGKFFGFGPGTEEEQSGSRPRAQSPQINRPQPRAQSPQVNRPQPRAQRPLGDGGSGGLGGGGLGFVGGGRILDFLGGNLGMIPKVVNNTFKIDVRTAASDPVAIARAVEDRIKRKFRDGSYRSDLN